MNEYDFRLEFDPDGTLRLRGRNGWREPVCPVCHEPIRWVLDVASFANQPDASFAFCHARCVWTREGLLSAAPNPPLYVYAITFDQNVFGIFRTEEAAEADLARQIEQGGPAWDGCKVERWKVGA